MFLAAPLAALLLAASPAAPAPAAPPAPRAPPAARATAAPPAGPGAGARDWASWNRARARQGLLPRKPPAPAPARARAAPRTEPLPAVARGRARRARPMVLAAVAAPDAPGLEGAAAEAAPASRGGSGAPSPASEARRGPTPPGPAPARERSSALHALLDGLSRGAAPAARVEVEGAGLGATVRGVRAAVAVIARAGKVTVALESGPGRPPGR